ncbi:MAG: hypothetical protein K0R39_1116 [Symbiobacteriaceae bacterium]|nr:hypothetical protein [Symbiobacteriaceae bacterium]
MELEDIVSYLDQHMRQMGPRGRWIRDAVAQRQASDRAHYEQDAVGRFKAYLDVLESVLVELPACCSAARATLVGEFGVRRVVLAFSGEEDDAPDPSDYEVTEEIQAFVDEMRMHVQVLRTILPSEVIE